MSLIHNERTKLLANAMDRLSTAFLAVGVLGQVFSLTGFTMTLTNALSLASWIFFAIALHLAARHILGRLRP